jgi:hypothetical protein
MLIFTTQIRSTVDVDPDNVAHEQYITNFVIELINVLETKVISDKEIFVDY